MGRPQPYSIVIITSLLVVPPATSLQVVQPREDRGEHNPDEEASVVSSNGFLNSSSNAHFGADAIGSKIPLFVFVTGAALENSSEVADLKHIITERSRDLTTKQGWEEKLDGFLKSSIQQFKPYAPAGTSFKYCDDIAMDTMVEAISQEFEKSEGVRGVHEAFRGLRVPAYRADLWRYLVLWKYGGVYLDFNIKLLDNLTSWIDFDHDDLVLIEDHPDKHGPMKWNAMMASSPRSGYLAHAINLAVSNINAQRYGVNPLDITGPKTLERALDNAHEAGINIPIRVDYTWTGNYYTEPIFVVEKATERKRIAMKMPTDKSSYWRAWSDREVFGREPIH